MSRPRDYESKVCLRVPSVQTEGGLCQCPQPAAAASRCSSPDARPPPTWREGGFTHPPGSVPTAPAPVPSRRLFSAEGAGRPPGARAGRARAAARGWRLAALPKREAESPLARVGLDQVTWEPRRAQTSEASGGAGKAD